MADMFIELNMKPRKIQVSYEKYDVTVFVNDDIAFTLEERYNDYDEAIEAIVNRIKGV